MKIETLEIDCLPTGDLPPAYRRQEGRKIVNCKLKIRILFPIHPLAPSISFGIIVGLLEEIIEDFMDKKIEIYSTPTCHYCHMTKDFLTEKNIPFTDYDVSVDVARRQEMIEKTGQMGVPVIVVGDQMMVGFEQNKLSELLGI